MSELEITAYDIYYVDNPRPWVFVRLTTNTGLTGIGEIPRTSHTTDDIARLGDRLVGADPFNTEALFGAGGSLGARANDIYTTTITGGFDMACWDIKGKHLGVPVHQLLGGKLRDRLRVYANGWDFDARDIVTRYHDGERLDTVLPDVTDEIARAAASVDRAGYSALKFSPFQWGTGANTTRAELDAALEAVRAVDEAVPDTTELLVEGHKRLTVDKAITISRKLERFDPGFYEEPVPADVETLRAVSERAPVPIATGESFVTHHGFADLIARTGVSVVQPDVGRAGGITELRKIAALASGNRIGFAPHNAAGPIMTFAAAHVDAVSPAFMIQESFEEFFHPSWTDEIVENQLLATDGFIEVPDTPGLGIRINEAKLENHLVT